VNPNPISLSTRLKGLSPNPSSGRVQLDFSLREPGTVVVRRGGHGRTRDCAHPGATLGGGRNWNVAWDGRRSQGIEAPPGIYFVQMHVNGRRAGFSRLALVH
jgi:hypothetical protein